MKITFLTPPPLDGKKVADRVAGCAYGLYPVPNVFELSVAAVVEKDGHDVRYTHFPILNQGPTHFERFLSGDDSDIYALYTVNLTRETDRIAHQRIRERRGDAPWVVYFGPAPSYNQEEFLIDGKTAVVRGEPEITFAEFARCVSDGRSTEIAGVSLKKNGEIFHGAFRPLIENVDVLPFPARHLLDRDKYFNPKLGLRPFTAAFGSRNCSYQCIYCVPCSLSFARELEYRRHHDDKKPPVRARSAANMIEEFRVLKEEGYKSVLFLDDQFLWQAQRTLDFCEGVKGFGIHWGCAARADHITEDAVRAMASAGCKFIDIGVESFDQAILDYVKKDLKVESIEKAVKIVRAAGIDAKLNILVGCSPLETRETIAKNREMVKRIHADQVMYNIANPFPGTKLYDIAKKEGWFVHGDYVPADVQKEAIINLPHLTAEEMVREVRKANFSFFLNPSFILKNVKRFHSPRDWYDGLKSLKRKLIG